MSSAIVSWFFFTTLVNFNSVKSDSFVHSAVKEIHHCLGRNLESCLVDRAIDSLLDTTQLSDVKNFSSNDERSFNQPIEVRLLNKLSYESGIPVVALTSQQTGRSRTFNRAWKYLIPFLTGVILKLAAFLPIVLSVLTLIAKNALITGNLALLLTGLNIALKYWYPKWSTQQHRPLLDLGTNILANFKNGHHNFGHHHFSQFSPHNAQDRLDDNEAYSTYIQDKNDLPYRPRPVYLDS